MTYFLVRTPTVNNADIKSAHLTGDMTLGYSSLRDLSQWHLVLGAAELLHCHSAANQQSINSNI